MQAKAWLTCTALAGLLANCGGAPHAQPLPPGAPQPVTPQATGPVTTATLADGAWGRAVLKRAALVVRLPERKAWRISKTTGWERIEHAATGSKLELQLSRAERLARPESCEAQARVQRPDLPRFDDEQSIDRRTLRAPDEFLMHVNVGIVEISPSEVQGHVLAFAASVGRCLAVHFVTRTSGPGFAEEAARRLGLVVDQILPTLQVIDVEDRVEPKALDAR